MKKGVFCIILLCVLMVQCIASASVFKNAADMLAGEGETGFSLRAEILKLPQYSEERTEELNRLLKHVSFSGSVGKARSVINILIDDETLFSYTESYDDGRRMIFFPEGSGAFFLHDTDMVSDGFISGNAFFRNLEYSFSLEAWAGIFAQLPSLFPEESKNAAISAQRYRDYGTAVRKTTIVLDGEVFTRCIQENPDLFSRSGAFPDPSLCIFEGRQTISLYYSQEDRLLRIVYSGKAGMEPSDMRMAKIDWKTISGEKFEKDEFILETPNAAKTKRDNLKLTYVRKIDENGAETLSWKADADMLHDGQRTRLISEAALRAENGIITGKMNEKKTAGKEHTSAESILNADFSGGEQCKGTLEINHKNDTIEKDHLMLSFVLSPAEPVQETESPAAAFTGSGGDASGNIRALYRRILERILKLPEEDLGFLKDGIPDELWNTIKPIRND